MVHGVTVIQIYGDFSLTVSTKCRGNWIFGLKVRDQTALSV